MIVKRSMMARCVVALTTLALATSAAPKDDKKKKGDDKPGTSMEEGGKDPAQTETFEAGQFVPGKKQPKKAATGEEGEEEESTEGEAAEAKPEPEKPIKVRKTVGLFGEAIIGFGQAPEPGPGTLKTGDATSFGFMIGGHVDVTNPFRLMLRLPLSTGTIKNARNPPSDTHVTALGVPELAGRLRLGEPGATEWALRLGVGIPIGQGNPDVTAKSSDTHGWEQARLQRVVNAANGWHDPELYTLKRIPVSPSLLFLYRGSKVRVNGELKLVLLPQIGGDVVDPTAGGPGGTFQYNGLGFWTILGGSVSYEVLSKKYLALAAWATYEIARDYEWSGGNPPSPLQFVIEPRILAQFGKVVPSVGFLLPLGGQLGGDIFGLRLHVDVVF